MSRGAGPSCCCASPTSASWGLLPSARSASPTTPLAIPCALAPRAAVVRIQLGASASSNLWCAARVQRACTEPQLLGGIVVALCSMLSCLRPSPFQLCRLYYVPSQAVSGIKLRVLGVGALL